MAAFAGWSNEVWQMCRAMKSRLRRIVDSTRLPAVAMTLALNLAQSFSGMARRHLDFKAGKALT